MGPFLIFYLNVNMSDQSKSVVAIRVSAVVDFAPPQCDSASIIAMCAIMKKCVVAPAQNAIILRNTPSVALKSALLGKTPIEPHHVRLEAHIGPLFVDFSVFCASMLLQYERANVYTILFNNAAYKGARSLSWKLGNFANRRFVGHGFLRRKLCNSHFAPNGYKLPNAH